MAAASPRGTDAGADVVLGGQEGGGEEDGVGAEVLHFLARRACRCQVRSQSLALRKREGVRTRTEALGRRGIELLLNAQVLLLVLVPAAGRMNHQITLQGWRRERQAGLTTRHRAQWPT